jgi:N-methylhydantoinase A/oxoprolinase/acetone carboxylase beta subunit
LTLKLGIDVGSTHTDAVILSERNELIKAVKSPTTKDVTSGIVKSLDLLLDNANIHRDEIKYAAIGTTHCINAIVERKNLNKVAVIRLSLPAGTAIEPMTDWPHDLKDAINGGIYFAKGGYEYDGREFNSIDRDEIINIGKDIGSREVGAVAVTGQFSPIRADQENEVAKILTSILGHEIPISLSHEIGRIGLIERENATILNAAVIGVAVAAAQAFEKALAERDVHAKIFFSQNDGTLMSVDYAKRYPILMISSGPTNSIRGAGFLTNLTDGIVLDIGGTTTLAGILVNGFPRESSTDIEIAGVKTNFRMPDLVSIGNGGGSIVRQHGNKVTIGPDSVGYNIVRDSIAWGGDTITTTDIALAAGYAKVDDPKCNPELAKKRLPSRLVYTALEKIVDNVEDAIERIRTTSDAIPAVLVGGGAIILPPDRYDRLHGITKVIRPPNFQFANAIGAAIAQVSGEIDKVFSLEHLTREEALRQAKGMAIEAAIAAGADPSSIQIVDIDEIFLSYLPSNAIRIKIKAAGQLRV